MNSDEGMKKTYENALKLLNGRRRTARPKTLPDVVPNHLSRDSSSLQRTVRGIPSLAGMTEWLQYLDHSISDLNNLNVIHVAGTKGKGSTCAFVSSFLKAHGSRTGFPRRIGLYTSPDLTCIRERIQINEQPILEGTFTKYFFEVWDRLETQNSRKPRFLQLLALVAFHTFIREKTDVVICETHHGGEFDATNVIERPIATGITSIGLDHIAQLGPTIEDIAWHKAGIMKRGTPGFCAPQSHKRVIAVLKTRAAEKGVSLKFVNEDLTLPADLGAFKAPVQRINCSLALALCGAFLEAKAHPGNRSLSSQDVLQGIRNFSWPGRFEIISEPKAKWYLDGAHNDISVKQAAEWFSKNMVNVENKSPKIILIYTHYSEERDGVALLENLAQSLKESHVRPQYAIFTSYQERKDGSSRLDKTLKAPEIPFPDLPAIYSEVWAKLDADAVVVRRDSIEEALEFARDIGNRYDGMEALVTGSLHLVGGALSVLRSGTHNNDVDKAGGAHTNP